MAKFQIPEYFKPGFDAIIKLSNDEAHALADVIKNIPVGSSPKSFLSQLKDQIDINEIGKIALTLSSLVGIRASENTTDEEVAQEIAESYAESITSELPKGEFEDLVKKLHLFFSNFGSLNFTYKAHSLLLSNDKLYKSAKIISDIRLIFNDNIQENSRNAVIIHKLKLTYENDGDEKESYISLDTSDLKKLKEQVERALEKDHLIKADYKGIITFIDIE